MTGAYEAATEAAGVAAGANSEYLDSIDGQLGVLKAHAEEF